MQSKSPIYMRKKVDEVGNKTGYLTISRRGRREYRRIVIETKSRWLFANTHVAWGD